MPEPTRQELLEEVRFLFEGLLEMKPAEMKTSKLLRAHAILVAAPPRVSNLALDAAWAQKAKECAEEIDRRFPWPT